MILNFLAKDKVINYGEMMVKAQQDGLISCHYPYIGSYFQLEQKSTTIFLKSKTRKL
jgi:hypothetical protein